MYRFMALSWNAAAPRGEATARVLVNRLKAHPRTQWHAAFNRPGLSVLHASAPSRAFHIYELANDQGVIIGKLHRGSSSLRAGTGALSSADADSIVASAGRQLVHRYWGRYIAFMVNPCGDKHIVRDPTGAVPCYRAELGNVTCLFSHIDDYLHLGPGELGINWPHVGAYLCFSRLVASETGLAGIGQLRAGECWTLTDRRVASVFHWDPARICAAEAMEEPGQALRELRSAIETSVGSWAGCYRRILLELSGGLDSSVILGCLGASDPDTEIICLNMHTEAPEGDERPFARKVAARAGRELVETVFKPHKRLAEMLVSEPLVSPMMVGLNSQAEDFRAQLASARGIEAVFTGRGGDQLFQRRRGAFIANEYVHRHGLRPELLRIAGETARLTGSAIWPVLRAVLAYRMFRRRRDPYSILRPPRFLHADAAGLIDDPRLRHPWVMAARDLPESKSQQIFDIVDTQNYFCMGTCNYADVVPALLSQPVLECVLRIPSYVLAIGGRERGLVRRAFADAVPSEVLRRTSKGEVVSFYLELLRKELPFLRELLLDGNLVKERLLDRRLLESALTENQLLRGAEVVPLLVAVKAEHWLRSPPRPAQIDLRTTA